MTQKLVKILRAFSSSYQRTIATLTSLSTMAGANPKPTLHSMMTDVRFVISFRAHAAPAHADIATKSTTSTSICTPILGNTRRSGTYASSRRQRRRQHSRWVTRPRRLSSRQAAQKPESQQSRLHWS